MNIEVYTPYKEVKEWVIDFLKDALLKWHKQHQEISRAEVYFKEKLRVTTREKICEIRLPIFKDDIMIAGRGKSFDQAARKAVTELNETMARRFHSITEPPDETVSTVEV